MSRLWKIILILVVIVVIIVALRSYEVKAPTVPAASQQVPLSQIEQMINAQASFRLPQNGSATDSTRDHLPPDIALLIVPSAHSLIVRQLNYTSGQTGYEASYTLSADIDTSNQNFVNIIKGSRQWQLVKVLKTTAFALTELQNTSAKVHISQLQLSGGGNAVLIQTLSR